MLDYGRYRRLNDYVEVRIIKVADDLALLDRLPDAHDDRTRSEVTSEAMRTLAVPRGLLGRAPHLTTGFQADRNATYHECLP